MGGPSSFRSLYPNATEKWSAHGAQTTERDEIHKWAHHVETTRSVQQQACSRRARRRAASCAYSSVNPSLTVTCQWAIWPSFTWPRVSVTLNHWMLRTVSFALAIAFCTASSMPFDDDPVSSSIL